MNRGFWDKLKKPIFALAPMANVTDAAFRSIIAQNGKPDVMWTEFVSVDGLLSVGKEKLMVDLKYSEAERPIVAQIFGSKPEKFEEAAKMLVQMGFDGIDINMGCPVQKVINQASCSALIRVPAIAQEIILATKRGAGDVPVSVKTRIGFNKIEIDTWIPALLATKPAALTVHLRTAKEMSKVPAHWELMPKIVEMVKALPEEDRPILLGNGDVLTLADAEQKVRETGCDGVMVGRGIFGNPWMFNRENPIEKVSIEDRMRAMLAHTKLFSDMFVPKAETKTLPAGGKRFEVMKKHYKAYVNNFDGASALRVKLMDEAETYADVERIIFEHFPSLKK